MAEGKVCVGGQWGVYQTGSKTLLIESHFLALFGDAQYLFQDGQSTRCVFILFMKNITSMIHPCCLSATSDQGSYRSGFQPVGF